MVLSHAIARLLAFLRSGCDQHTSTVLVMETGNATTRGMRPARATRFAVDRVRRGGGRGCAGRSAQLAEHRGPHGRPCARRRRDDTNYTHGSTQVATSKTISLPDTTILQNGGGSTPEPWSVALPIDQTLTHSGAFALIVDVTTAATSVATAYMIDGDVAQPGILFRQTTAQRNFDGCIATGSSSMQLLV
jgi:hypothetical protein